VFPEELAMRQWNPIEPELFKARTEIQLLPILRSAALELLKALLIEAVSSRKTKGDMEGREADDE
jgi:hypothetical protein